MDFLNEYGLLILVVTAIISIVLLIITLIFSMNLNKKFLTNKFRFKTYLESDGEKDETKVSIIVSNTSLIDMVINSLGIINNNKHYDYINNYIKDNNIVAGNVVVPQRGSIKLELPSSFVEDRIIKENGNNKFLRLQVYSIDKAGNISKSKAKAIRNLLNNKRAEIINNKLKEEKIEKEKQVKAKVNDFLESYNLKITNNEKVKLKDKIIAKYYEIVYKNIID